MATHKLFGNRIPPACRYCETALRCSALDGTVLCSRKGVVAADYSCKSYQYDPLKRIPKQPLDFQEFKEADFSII